MFIVIFFIFFKIITCYNGFGPGGNGDDLIYEKELEKRNDTTLFWNDIPIYERGEPPYKLPVDRVYNTTSGPVPGKINLHFVPHSHDDTGWLITVDQYYYDQVYYILDTVINQLSNDINRKFMFVETAFFARWYEEQDERRRKLVKELVNNKQLEFINGGWCMHDEASPYYIEMVDQTTRGHQYLKAKFGNAGIPEGTWQIDPFGHSNTQAWLLSAEAGMNSLFFGRMDYQDLNYRRETSRLEYIWDGSNSLSSSAQVFTGQLFGKGGGGYSTFIAFDSEIGIGNKVQDNPNRHDYNVDKWIDKIIKDAKYQDKHTKTSHQMWACGNDFNYMNADLWYHNLDKLIHYLNQNGTINAFYSTPTKYVEAKYKSNITWEVRRDDIFPLADNKHSYWSGYFTSRPALKRQVRVASNYLNTARQLELLSNTNRKDIKVPLTRPSPIVGSGWTDALEGAIGVATHHDGMSGTARQSVTNDFVERISDAMVEVEAGLSIAIEKLVSKTKLSKKLASKTKLSKKSFGICGCNSILNCLNISTCSYTVNTDDFTFVAYNSNGREKIEYISIPVTTRLNTTWEIIELYTNKSIPIQLFPISNRTKNIPLLYINKFKKNKLEIEKEYKSLQNPATHYLIAKIQIPAIGYNTFHAKTKPLYNTKYNNNNNNNFIKTDKYIIVKSNILQIKLDRKTNKILSLVNLKTNVQTDFNIQYGFYKSSNGECTSIFDCPSQSSGTCK